MELAPASQSFLASPRLECRRVIVYTTLVLLEASLLELAKLGGHVFRDAVASLLTQPPVPPPVPAEARRSKFWPMMGIHYCFVLNPS